MCDAKPGKRCAADTCRVAELTARAYYEMYGPQAPPVDPEAAAAAVMAVQDNPAAGRIGADRLTENELRRHYRVDLAELRRENLDATPEEFRNIVQVWRAEQIIAAGGKNPLPPPQPVSCGAGGSLAQDATIEFVPGQGWKVSAAFIKGGPSNDYQSIDASYEQVLPTREDAEEYLSTLTKYGPGDVGPNPVSHNLLDYPHRRALGREAQRARERATEARKLHADLGARVTDARERERLKDEFHYALSALRAAGVEHDADHPVAAQYRAASDAVNHANRKADFDIMSGMDVSLEAAVQARSEANTIANALEAKAGALEERHRAWEKHIETLGVAQPATAWTRSAELREQIAAEYDPFKKDALITEHNVLVPKVDRLAHVVPAPSLTVIDGSV